MENPRTRKGRFAEDLAAAYLRLVGFEILDRNLRVSHKEIDLLALDGDCLTFVEVKLRTSAACGSAAESLRPGQLRTLRAAIRGELARRAWRGDYRLDFLAIDLDRNGERLVCEHYRGI